MGVRLRSAEGDLENAVQEIAQVRYVCAFVEQWGPTGYYDTPTHKLWGYVL